MNINSKVELKRILKGGLTHDFSKITLWKFNELEFEHAKTKTNFLIDCEHLKKTSLFIWNHILNKFQE